MLKKQPAKKNPFILLEKIFNYFSESLNFLATVWILALMLLITADVIGRAFFAHPIAGVPEMVSLSIVGIVFLQLSSTLRANRITRSDMLFTVLKKRAPKFKYFLDSIFSIAGVYITVVIAKASYPKLLKAIDRQEFVGAIGHFTAPTWPIKLIIIVGSIAIAIQFAINAIKSLNSLFRGNK